MMLEVFSRPSHQTFGHDPVVTPWKIVATVVVHQQRYENHYEEGSRQRVCTLNLQRKRIF